VGHCISCYSLFESLVTTCVMNQSRHLTFFDIELDLLSQKMWHEVVKVIKPFLKNLKTFDFRQVHKSWPLMLNLCFKSLTVMKNFVGCGNAICLVIEYNVKEVIIFLMTIFDLENSIIKAFCSTV